jgi:hypothetical protein
MIMNRNLHQIWIFFAAAILAIALNASSQKVSEELTELFMNHYAAGYQERIFVHLDRQYYLAGEKVRFSIFCLEPGSLRPSVASSVAYIELVDHQNLPIIRDKVSLIRGFGSGSLEIPPSCNSQEYILRCYTAWQRNEGPGAYYYNNILILNPSKPMKLAADRGTAGENVTAGSQRTAGELRTAGEQGTTGSQRTAGEQGIGIEEGSGSEEVTGVDEAIGVDEATGVDEVTGGDLEFRCYPEGGHLVPGVMNRFIFTVTDKAKAPCEANGEILRDDSVKVASISTSWPGIGAWSMVPESGREYTAKIREPGGHRAVFSLSPSPGQACAVELIRDPDGMRSLLVRPHHLLCEIHAALTLLVWRPSGIELMQEAEADTLIQFVFHDHRFPAGIHYITLVDRKLQIMAERSFFVQKEDSLEIRIVGLEDAYTSRETIAFRLETLAPGGLPATSRLSVSVSCRGDDLAHAHPNSFLQSILLGGEVPELYSLQEKEISRDLMDLYMIIHSAGKCNWLQHERSNAVYIPEKEGLVVSGEIIHEVSRTPADGRELFLSFIDSIPHFYSTSSNEQGRFHFGLDQPIGAREMVVQVNAEGNEEDVLITLDDDFSRDPIPDLPFGLLNRPGLEELFEKLLLHRQLAMAYSLQADPTTVQSVAARGDMNPFYGEPDHRIILEEFITLPVMEEVFRELGKRIFLVRKEGRYLVRLLDLNTNRIIGDQPFYFIDGIPVFDPEILMGLDPSRVHSIRLKSQRYFMKHTRMDGIVDIRTTRGDAGPVILPPSAIRQTLQCLSAQEAGVFIDSSAMSDPRIPVFLTTPFFGTPLSTSPGQAAAVSFPAPDSKGPYDIVVKALDAQGRIGEERFTILIR